LWRLHTGSNVAATTAASQANQQRAARDIAVQVLARLANLALGVLVTALLARTLGTTRYGQWVTILAVLALTAYFANFGMEGVVVREVAREPEHEREWLGAAMLLRLITLGPVLALSLVAILLLQESRQMLLAGVIVILAMPFDGVGAMQLVFQLRIKNTVPMVVLTLRSVLWAGAVAIIFLRGGDMVALAIALALTNAVGSIVQALAARRMLGRWPRPSRRRLAPLVRAGVPLGISVVLITAYANIDQVIVFELAGSRAAGLYGAAYRVLEQAHFVPISVLTTVTPIIAASWPRDRARMLRAAGVTAELMAVASFGALAFVTVAAAPLTRLIFGAGFSAAAPALPVLFGAFVFICFGYLNGNLLTVLGLQRGLLAISVGALVVNVAGNLVFVPLVGFMGAAWMTLVTEIVVFGASSRLIQSRLELRLPGLGRIARTLLAAGLLAAVLEGLSVEHASLAVLLAAACVCYPALLFGLRALEVEDVRLLLRRGTPA
jgi:O-antigen/teichoic acid export membrane protein